MNTNQQIVTFQEKGQFSIKVRIDNENVWLNINEIADLFKTSKQSISYHLIRIYKEKELKKNSTVKEILTVQKEGNRNISRNIEYYNLDAVLSVGYRINSKIATKFRIWATKTLKEHLVKGYTLNENRLLEAKNKFKEIAETIEFLKNKSKNILLEDKSQQIIDIIANYSKTLTLLEKYDKNNLKQKKGTKNSFILDYENSVKIINILKEKLIEKKEASELFGAERQGKMLDGLIGNLYQTFNDIELYSNIEIKAANLLYLIIKDHPFTDGNKRIASFIFIYFLEKNNYLYKETGEKKINDNALTALALLIAISKPNEKEIMINLITNLLNEENV